MTRIKLLYLLLCLATFAAGVFVYEIKKNLTPCEIGVQNQVGNPQLREELLRRMKADQDLQKDVFGKAFSGQEIPLELLERRKVAETENTEWIKKVIEQSGYPGYALVGRDGSDAAGFLLIQHLKGDAPFQKKVLELARKSVAQNDASPDLVAALIDRMMAAEGKPQVYGTHLRSNKGVLEPSAIEDEANVEKRRREAGLPSMTESIKSAQNALPKLKSENIRVRN